MRFLLTFMLLFSVDILYSQELVVENDGVVITMDRKIDSLIRLRCARKLEYNMIPGWRVQIDFSDNKENLLKTREKFIKYHPKVETYLTFDKPYWKLIVGNYPDRNDAEKLIRDIAPHYSSLMLLKTLVFEPRSED